MSGVGHDIRYLCCRSCTDSRQSAASLLELCQSHTACRSIILTLGGAVHPATGRHAAAAAGQLLQLAGEVNHFLLVLAHNLEPERGSCYGNI